MPSLTSSCMISFTTSTSRSRVYKCRMVLLQKVNFAYTPTLSIQSNYIHAPTCCRLPTKAFHAMKTEWGEVKFVERQVFGDASNGYLINDACVFGAEVFILKQNSKSWVLVDFWKTQRRQLHLDGQSLFYFHIGSLRIAVVRRWRPQMVHHFFCGMTVSDVN